MEIPPAHASITANTDTSAGISLILTECAGLGTPLTVWHLKQGREGQLVNLKIKARHYSFTLTYRSAYDGVND